MWTLLDRAENIDCNLPLQFSPSLSRLTLETGLSRATVAAGLSHLEQHGWLQRDQRAAGQARGTRKAGYGRGRVHYTLVPGADPEPCGCPEPVKKPRRQIVQPSDHLQQSDSPIIASQIVQSDPEFPQVTERSGLKGSREGGSSGWGGWPGESHGSDMNEAS